VFAKLIDAGISNKYKGARKGIVSEVRQCEGGNVWGLK
jgi:hypothetical protein